MKAISILTISAFLVFGFGCDDDERRPGSNGGGTEGEGEGQPEEGEGEGQSEEGEGEGEGNGEADTGIPGESDGGDQGTDAGDDLPVPGEYPIPYGTGITLSATTSYIVTTENPPTQDMVSISAFASGSFGETGIVPPQGDLTYHLSAVQQGFVIIQQATQAGNALVNPVVMLQAAQASVTSGATLNVGVTQDSQAFLTVSDVTATGERICTHALGHGTVTVTEADLTPGAAGGISLTGTVDLYSPAAFMDMGDISADLQMPPCPAQ